MDPTSGGFDIELVMARDDDADDSITITNPTTKKCQLRVAKHPRFAADAEDQPIEVEIIMKGIQIVINDTTVTY